MSPSVNSRRPARSLTESRVSPIAGSVYSPEVDKTVLVPLVNVAYDESSCDASASCCRTSWRKPWTAPRNRGTGPRRGRRRDPVSAQRWPRRSQHRGHRGPNETFRETSQGQATTSGSHPGSPVEPPAKDDLRLVDPREPSGVTTLRDRSVRDRPALGVGTASRGRGIHHRVGQTGRGDVTHLMSPRLHSAVLAAHALR